MPTIVLDSSHKLHKFLPEKNVNVSSEKTTYTRLQPTVSNIVFVFLPWPICNMVTMDFNSFIIYRITFYHIYLRFCKFLCNSVFGSGYMWKYSINSFIVFLYH